ncbi:bacterial regulatory s, tetR family protein [Lyngbya aestuarii BL J]|uniref:Bacterial regulatory s, tetR family protein n=1 Tax=Lyngbya aestuarii BL J TaxID=1348334 RepID=U7QCY3_9CYAN|nr:TetR/AcrR family transcriptional regulator [Lyngbya aestuarii]ERT04576.1 bacterial regulatory s, tetR family protein [Lyngbya aestuarii BL J]
MAKTKSSSRSCVRDRILTTASELFYKEGVQNVGIDRIIAESGVAKMSLYNHFKSKDALIAAWLQQQDESWRTWFQETVERLATQPEDRVLAIFDALKECFEQPDFRGCAFLNSAVELVDPEHPGYQVSLEHQQATFDYMLSLVKAANLPDAEELTEQLVILAVGATVVAMMKRNSSSAMQAKQAAAQLIAERQLVNSRSQK